MHQRKHFCSPDCIDSYNIQRQIDCQALRWYRRYKNERFSPHPQVVHSPVRDRGNRQVNERHGKLQYQDGHNAMESHEEGALIRIGTHQGIKEGKHP